MSEDSQPEPDFTFDAQYERILEISDVTTQAQLVRVLGIRQSSVSDAKRRRSIPAEWVLKLVEKKRANPKWIRSGLGDKLLFDPKNVLNEAKEDQDPIIVHGIERRPSEECTTEELIAAAMRRVVRLLNR